jgi:hypothetical protein
MLIHIELSKNGSMAMMFDQHHISKTVDPTLRFANLKSKPMELNIPFDTLIGILRLANGEPCTVYIDSTVTVKTESLTCSFPQTQYSPVSLDEANKFIDGLLKVKSKKVTIDTNALAISLENMKLIESNSGVTFKCEGKKLLLSVETDVSSVKETLICKGDVGSFCVPTRLFLDIFGLIRNDSVTIRYTDKMLIMVDEDTKQSIHSCLLMS